MVVLETIVRLELLVISKGKKKKKNLCGIFDFFFLFRSKVSWIVGLVFAWLIYIKFRVNL